MTRAHQIMPAAIFRNAYLFLHPRRAPSFFALFLRCSILQAEYMLEKCLDLDVDARDDLQETALHTAAERASLGFVNALIRAKADVEATDVDQETPLTRAATEGHAAVANALLDAGANIEAAAVNHETPLMRAAINGHIEVVGALLSKERGAKKEAGDERGRTPLMRASEDLQLSTVKVLLKAGAKVHARDKVQQTSLILAATSERSPSPELVSNSQTF